MQTVPICKLGCAPCDNRLTRISPAYYGTRAYYWDPPVSVFGKRPQSHNRYVLIRFSCPDKYRTIALLQFVTKFVFPTTTMIVERSFYPFVVCFMRNKPILFSNLSKTCYTLLHVEEHYITRYDYFTLPDNNIWTKIWELSKNNPNYKLLLVI